MESSKEQHSFETIFIIIIVIIVDSFTKLFSKQNIVIFVTNTCDRQMKTVDYTKYPFLTPETPPSHTKTTLHDLLFF